jgi:hypothetical protein
MGREPLIYSGNCAFHDRHPFCQSRSRELDLLAGASVMPRDAGQLTGGLQARFVCTRRLILGEIEMRVLLRICGFLTIVLGLAIMARGAESML